MPSLTKVHTWMVGLVLFALAAIGSVIVGATSLVGGACWVAAAMCFLMLCNQRRQEILSERADWRHERFMEAVRQNPPLPPETDWSEIERAMGALMEDGVEPTYERAKDWLRREEAIAKLPNPDHVVYCLMNNGGEVCNYPGPCKAQRERSSYRDKGLPMNESPFTHPKMESGKPPSPFYKRAASWLSD